MPNNLTIKKSIDNFAASAVPAKPGEDSHNRPVEEFLLLSFHVLLKNDQLWPALRWVGLGGGVRNVQIMRGAWLCKPLQMCANICAGMCTESVNVCKWVQNRSKCAQNGDRNVHIQWKNCGCKMCGGDKGRVPVYFRSITQHPRCIRFGFCKCVKSKQKWAKWRR